jgi:subtilisin family serine protease
MRNLLLCLLSFCITGLFGQNVKNTDFNEQPSKINLSLKIALEKKTDQHQLFPLFVVGNAAKIKLEVLRLKGEVIRSVKDIVQVNLPVGSIENFSKNDFVHSLPFSMSPGQALSDTMLIHNNVKPIHNGVSPLLQRYTGKGVVFGVIDTGMDTEHPDFKDTLGNTRIYRIWDQNTGEIWDSSSINNGTCTHYDYNGSDHGTHVTGIGVGNGLAVNNFAGVAGEATIVAVSTNFNAPNWLSTFVDAVAYIYAVADSLGMPCVINASVGTYMGSHDGTDPAAILVDSLINYKSGRALVCAAGNLGYSKFHIGQNVTADTNFTWLRSSLASNDGVVFYEIWSDTADFNAVDFAFGVNLSSGTFEEKGRTPFFNVQNRVGLSTDTIKNGMDNVVVVQTYGELQGDKYLMQVLFSEPDADNYNFSILSTGLGKFDFWSASALGMSEIVATDLPNIAIYPPIINYTLPDTAQTMVSSFSCSPHVITVANFTNRKTYLDVNYNEQIGIGNAGEIARSSSLGPNRRGVTKPDIGATGDETLGARSAGGIASLIGSGQSSKVAVGGMHGVNGGTSMASPVVAGVVALYLEKCPNASMVEIKSAILGSAKQDVFTGTVPNNSFGYGKIDAFAALNLSNNNISLGDDLVVCGDTITELISPASIDYLWSTGATTQNITIDSTITSAHVAVTNGSGCKALSDTLNIIWKSIPEQPILTVVDHQTLVYNTSEQIQWYYNSTGIVGETDTILTAQNNGSFHLELTDSFGCTVNSDTITFTAVGVEEFEDKLVSIYPNPSDGEITVKFDIDNANEYRLINALGEIVLKSKIKKSKKSLEIDLSEFAEGVYYMNISTNKNNYLKKLILLR